MWLKTLRKHLRDHVIPAAIAQGNLQSLQDSLLAALAPPTEPGVTYEGRRSPQTLPLESEIVSVSELKKVKKSFRAILRPQFGGGHTSNSEGKFLSLLPH